MLYRVIEVDGFTGEDIGEILDGFWSYEAAEAHGYNMQGVFFRIEEYTLLKVRVFS